MSGLLNSGGLMSQGAYQDIGEGLLSGRFSQPQGQGLLGALRGIGDPLYSMLGVPPPPRWEDDRAAREMAQGIRNADVNVIGDMIGPGALIGMARVGKSAAKSAAKQKIDDATGLPLNEDGTVTVYHGTTREAADQIAKEAQLKSAGEPDVYVTTARDGTGYGDGTVVAVRVDPRKLELDDEFPDGRKDFRINVGRPGGTIKIKPERAKQ